MKAILLAAGAGTRLRPQTDTLPKCLLPVAGRTLLEHWLDRLAREGVGEVLVVIRHRGGDVEDHLRRISRAYPFAVRLVHEPVPVGTAGALRDAAWFIRDQEAFLAICCDVLAEIRLARMLESHLRTGGPVTVALTRDEHAPRQGVAHDVTIDGCVRGLTLRCPITREELVAAGIYAMNATVLRNIPTHGFFDIRRDLLPRFASNMYSYEVDGLHVDVDTPADYDRARRMMERAHPAVRTA